MSINPLIEKFIPVAEMIAQTFGKHCEVIIHDFSNPQNSVIYTCNNTVTNRQVGESFTEYFIKEVLLSRKFHDDCSANYMMKGKDGQIIKSSTALIRNNEGKVLGAMCVNIDISCIATVMNQFSDMFGVEDTYTNTDNEVEVVPHIKEIVDDIIDKTIGDQDVNNMSREKRIELIKFMNSKGIFLIKGSTDKVADRMNISRVTVYGYLDEIKKEKSN
jgi:predicted transcriptional regulator YheO